METMHEKHSESDETNESYDQWSSLGEAESKTLLDSVKEKFSTPSNKKIARGVVTALITTCIGATILAGGIKNLDQQNATSAEALYQETLEESLPEESLTDRVSIYYKNDREMTVIAGGQEMTVPVEAAGDADTYLKLGISEEDTRALLEKFQELQEVRDDGYHDEEGFVRTATEIYSDAEMEQIRQENDEKIAQIIADLELEDSLDIKAQLANCLKVQQYIVESNTYDIEIMGEKTANLPEQARDVDLHRGLIEQRSVCTSNSFEFQSILEEMGVNVKSVALKNAGDSDDNVVHMANLVELNGEYYYFDTTLEQSIYDNQKQVNPDQELIFCAAGLGKEEYEQFYEPVGIITTDMQTEDVPANIAETRIPPIIFEDVMN